MISGLQARWGESSQLTKLMAYFPRRVPGKRTSAGFGRTTALGRVAPLAVGFRLRRSKNGGQRSHSTLSGRCRDAAGQAGGMLLLKRNTLLGS